MREAFLGSATKRGCVIDCYFIAPAVSGGVVGWAKRSVPTIFGMALDGGHVAALLCPPYSRYFTAPAVSPATICLCANTVSRSTGAVTISAAAASGPQLS